MIAAIVDGLVTSPLLVCLALAYGLTYGLLGIMDLTIGARVAASGYGAWLAGQAVGITGNPVAAIPLWLGAVCGALLLGAATWSFLMPLLKTEALSMLIGSLGVSYCLSALFQVFLGANPVTFTTYPVEEGVRILGTTATPLQLTAVGYTLFLTLFLGWILARTRLGASLEVVATDPELGRTVFGLDQQRMAWLTVAITSAIVAPAGFLYAVGHGVSPVTGSGQALLAFVCTIATGRHRPMAAALIAFLIATFGAVLIGWNAVQWLLFGLALTVALVLSMTLRRFRPCPLSITLVQTVVVGLAFAHYSYESIPFLGESSWANYRVPSAFQWFAQFTLLTICLLWRSRGIMARAMSRED